MFRTESINRYFLKVELKKSCSSSLGTNSSSIHVSAGSKSIGNVPISINTQIGALVGTSITLKNSASLSSPIVVTKSLLAVGSDSGSGATTVLQEYSLHDPRYVHVEGRFSL
jgi:hypothetical protein